ncbi:NAD dependent epimerase/dehydratase family protein [Halopelagius inordinatus]|uniref:NAD dependent epimerase/dehydratase family protein n=1 Tax=Halopelagius inordinatus TaxID=553467 RepID=A0A1I2VT69_9EURY|nr:NAD(P)-dependent oxidoreductase [Halopelagius inordinatus]SFG91547.1 NAD dependent epimerase/dehydratase family protein [Halopelagius inordinatus]
MARIALTGAGGSVGREVLGAFDDHDVVPFTHSETDGVDSELVDVTDPDDVAAKIDDADVVIHLAGASSPDSEWETVSETNIEGTKNVLDAMVENGIGRLVFASSNHAVGTYNAADENDPESMTLSDTRPVRGDAPTRPDSFYGVSKVACEGLTDFYASRHGIEVVNLRIGWYMSEDRLEENTGEDVKPGNARFARATWLSPHDCRDVHRKAALADLLESPVTVNAVSRNDDRFHSITETMQALGYEPRDNSAETLDG